MRVLFDATTLGSDLGGDETYLSGVLEGLAEVAPDGDEFPLLVRPGARLPDPVATNRQFPTRLLTKRPGPVHYGFTLPRALAAFPQPFDLVHTITHAPFWGPAPVALTVGDLSFLHHPDFYPPFARARLNQLVPRQARAARVVLAPSDFSRVDLVEAYGLDPDRVFAVPNRVRPVMPLPEEERARAVAWLRDRGVQEPYFAYLGNLHPRKNVPRLIEAFASARRSGELGEARLVIAGGRWFGEGPEDTAARQAPAGSVVLVGRVDDAVARVLLEGAVALTYPSLFEGFGLPPVEAMALGTPVLAGDAAAVPDVCGDAALLVDPTSVDAIAGGMVRLLADDPLRATLRERGRLRAGEYTAARTGRAALRAFRCAVGATDQVRDGADPHSSRPGVVPAAQRGSGA